MTNYTVDGTTATESTARAEWLARDNGDGEIYLTSEMVWRCAHERSQDGYIAREYIEAQGVTIRHDGDE